MKYASIDIGTNSCRLMIAEIENGGFKVLYRDMKTTRIGAGLSSSGQISPEAAERTLQCLGRFQDAISRKGVADYLIVATSAVREAANRAWFEELCRLRLHKEVKVISGEEEAHLTYKGVQKSLLLDRPLLVADLGGGSTELIYSQEDLYVRSLPLGAVKGAEIQITERQIMDILEEIKEVKVRFSDAALVFCGGTATSAGAMKYGMIDYDSSLVHGQRLKKAEVQQCYDSLLNMPLEKRKNIRGLQTERADIIVYGLMIMLNLMRVLEKDWAVVSESDLLEGLIWEMDELKSPKSASS